MVLGVRAARRGASRIPLAAAAASLAVGLLAACSSGSGEGSASPGTATVGSAPVTIRAADTTAPAGSDATASVPQETVAPPDARYYVSLGDSYAAGYEAGVGTTTNGFAYQVVDEAAADAYPLQLVNFGCSGATTVSVLETTGCPPDALGPGAAPYPDQTQAEAAEQFLREHRGQVDLITVSIGGNDVTACAVATDPVSCVTDAAATLSANVPALLHGLRDAAGPDVVIVGTTYPDVVLGEWVGSLPNGQQLATLSVVAFRDIINPALQKAYTDAGGQFVDVTAATGAYGSMEETTTLAPYGDIPVPVAKVCELTYYCDQRDIHPNTAGYHVIADLVVEAFSAAKAAGA